MTRPHYRTEQIGLRLIHHIAPAVTVALDNLRREQSQCDGWPTKGNSVGRGGGPTVYVDADDYEDAGRIPVTGVEAVAFTANNFGGRAQQIQDTIESIEISVGYLAKLVIGIDHTPAAGEEKRCGDGQRVWGRTLEWSDNDQCPELAVRKGMCLRHYMRWYRHRIEHHLPVDQYFEEGAGS